MTIDRPEDAARHDIGDALAGGEVGISREYADQLAADSPGTGEVPVPPKADAPQKQAEAEGGSAAAVSASEAQPQDRRAPERQDTGSRPTTTQKVITWGVRTPQLTTSSTT